MKWMPYVALIAGLLLTLAIYVPGLNGGFIFDDYPNIVDNAGLHPKSVSVGSLVRASLSSPASEFKRPLASLTFAANILATGDNPAPMKATNIVIHLLNGLACFFLTRLLLAATRARGQPITTRDGFVAALVATAWMLLPINLTSVLYVVQRMESLANLFVFLALIGYVKARQAMRTDQKIPLVLAVAAITVLPLIGVMAKETAILVPLYALLIELVFFRGRSVGPDGQNVIDRRVRYVFVVLLAIPFVLGSVWMAIKLSNPRAWASRDFTLETRLLSECRIVVDYIAWTLFPRSSDLSFYHDDFSISTGWLSPPTTLLGALAIAALLALTVAIRRKRPLVALGLGLFFACHVLTATVIPLELIYEHRNYFASYGLMLAVIPLLAGNDGAHRLLLPRRAVLAALLIYWTLQTGMAASAWGSPLGLAAELAARAPASPRAQYELGRTYIILSRYDPHSPFTRLAYAPLERAMELPRSSILPEQALIFLNARMHIPLKDTWWESIVRKLKVRRPSVQDESSLGALGTCAIQDLCDLPKDRMVEAFSVALSHPNPTARLLAMYSDYAWAELGDLPLAYRTIKDATVAAPTEPNYIVTRARIAIRLDDLQDAEAQLKRLEDLNIGGSLNTDIGKVRSALASARKP
ncbi:hypothetical protein ACQKIE_18870 [Luteibacter sp. NPDC031894]|uniref:hypothetical protein n=1 Tax=Luteibacter sp. NPDC031894 TaxID=3390572 RepID=UPI003D0672C0